MPAEVIDRRDALEPVFEPWRRLATTRGSAFLTPEWYLTALDVVHDDGVPAVAVARNGNGAVEGLLPLVWTDTAGRHGTAEVPATRFADVFQLVCEESNEDAVAAAVAPALAQHLGRRCQLRLGRLDPAGGWWGELARAWPASLTAVTGPEEALPYVMLDGTSWEEYLASRTGQFRSQVRRKMRSLQRDHEVRVRRTATAEEVAGDIKTLFELHERRWAGRDQASSLADARLRAFHRRFAVAAQENGWLRLYLLEVDGVPVAAWYGWRVGERYAYYQAGFDPAWARHSVGFLLMAETIREAIAEGAAEYDLLLGDEPFKLRFATAQHRARWTVLAPPLSRTRIAQAAANAARAGVRALPEAAQRSLRRLRGRLRGPGP